VGDVRRGYHKFRHEHFFLCAALARLRRIKPKPQEIAIEPFDRSEAGAENILNGDMFDQSTHTQLPILKSALKPQSANASNSIRHCMGSLHRPEAERSACATRLRTRFDCSVVGCGSWLANQNREGVGGQSQLRKKISLFLFSVNALLFARAA